MQFPSKLLALLALTLGGLGSTGLRAQSYYILTDVGTLGGNQSWVNAMNASGQAVGYSYTVSGNVHAFLYDGKMHDLGTLGGASSVAQGINDSGVVAGYSSPTGQDGTEHGFFYNGTMHDLGSLGGNFTDVRGLNNSGEIVGASQEMGDTVWVAFYYASGTMTGLGNLGGSQTYAQAVNVSGQIAGFTLSMNGHTQPWLYSNGNLTNLGTLGGDYGVAYAMNSAGHVVGDSTNADPSLQTAFLYDGTMHNLGTIGGNYSGGYGINTAGVIVGGSTIPVAETEHAMRYASGVMTDLNKLGIAGGAGWTLERATAINDAGQIAGYGKNPQGVYHGFILTPLLKPAVPKITAQPAGLAAKKGATVKFTVKATSTAPLAYVWKKDNVSLKNGAKISGATSASLTLKNVIKASAGKYRVVVSNIVGNTTSAVAKLTVN